MNELEVLINIIRSSLPGASTQLDTPDRPEDRWWVDLKLRGHGVTVEWRQDWGFGISAPATSGFGEAPEEHIMDMQLAASRVIELLSNRRNTTPPKRVLLRELRAMLGMTQEQLAKELGTRQPAVSKIERRHDTTISTLRRVIEALGGTLELVAHFPEYDVELTQFSESGEKNGAVELAGD